MHYPFFVAFGLFLIGTAHPIVIYPKDAPKITIEPNASDDSKRAVTIDTNLRTRHIPALDIGQRSPTDEPAEPKEPGDPFDCLGRRAPTDESSGPIEPGDPFDCLGRRAPTDDKPEDEDKHDDPFGRLARRAVTSRNDRREPTDEPSPPHEDPKDHDPFGRRVPTDEKPEDEDEHGDPYERLAKKDVSSEIDGRAPTDEHSDDDFDGYEPDDCFGKRSPTDEHIDDDFDGYEPDECWRKRSRDIRIKLKNSDDEDDEP